MIYTAVSFDILIERFLFVWANIIRMVLIATRIKINAKWDLYVPVPSPTPLLYSLFLPSLCASLHLHFKRTYHIHRTETVSETNNWPIIKRPIFNRDHIHRTETVSETNNWPIIKRPIFNREYNVSSRNVFSIYLFILFYFIFGFIFFIIVITIFILCFLSFLSADDGIMRVAFWSSRTSRACRTKRYHRIGWRAGAHRR